MLGRLTPAIRTSSGAGLDDELLAKRSQRYGLPALKGTHPTLPGVFGSSYGTQYTFHSGWSCIPPIGSSRAQLMGQQTFFLSPKGLSNPIAVYSCPNIAIDDEFRMNSRFIAQNKHLWRDGSVKRSLLSAVTHNPQKPSLTDASRALPFAPRP